MDQSFLKTHRIASVAKERVLTNSAKKPKVKLKKLDFSRNIRPLGEARKPLRTSWSSTMVKKMDVPKRHGDLWTPMSQPIGSTRNLAIHTNRTMGDDMSVGPFSECNSENLTQTARDRHITDASPMEQLRGPRKRGDLLLHREPVNLLMGGRSMELSEREDIASEIQRLKTVMLPTRAKDLYVGRGFKLPAGHALNNPKMKKTSVSSQGGQGVRHGGNGDTLTIWQKTRSLGKNGTKTPSGNTALRNVTGNNPLPEIPVGKGGASVRPAAPDAAKTKTNSPTDAPPAPPVTREGNGTGEDLGTLGRTPAGTPGPFRGFNVSEVLPQEEIDKLKETFTKLDSDSTGHLQFSQLEQLKEFTPNQQLFLQQVYELASIGTVFGFNEFASLSEFCKRLETISEEAKQAYEKADMETIGDSIKQYLELFQSLDQTDTGKMALASLKGILAMVKEKEFTDEMFAPVKTVVATEGSDDISKLDYLACIPYFMCLEAG